MIRHDGRKPGELRGVKIQRNFTKFAGGSVIISFGQTQVLCTAMIEKDLPPWLKAKGPGAGGWLTAEYGMLPSSTTNRKRREVSKPDSRGVEIQRLIGRALRSIIDLKALDGLTLFVDCDVLQADGGTRTASITGAYVAAVDAVRRAQKSGLLAKEAKPITGQLAAVSVGLIAGNGGKGGTAVLDLDYPEDVEAGVDMNVAMLADGTFVEVQGTGEHATFSPAQLQAMLKLAASGIRELHKMQTRALGK